MLVPGFIDTQVNGGGGALFNEAPTSETIATIGRAHRAFGTTGFLPTLISDDLHGHPRRNRSGRAGNRGGVPGVLGIHIEGPFLNEHRKGIHDSEKIRALDEEGFAVLTSLKRGAHIGHGRTRVHHARNDQAPRRRRSYRVGGPQQRPLCGHGAPRSMPA